MCDLISGPPILILSLALQLLCHAASFKSTFLQQERVDWEDMGQQIVCHIGFPIFLTIWHKVKIHWSILLLIDLVKVVRGWVGGWLTTIKSYFFCAHIVALLLNLHVIWVILVWHSGLVAWLWWREWQEMERYLALWGRSVPEMWGQLEGYQDYRHWFDSWDQQRLHLTTPSIWTSVGTLPTHSLYWICYVIRK